MKNIKSICVVWVALILAAAPVFAQKAPKTSPLAKYPGFGHDAEADEAQFEEEEAAREERIVRCMEREGFTYWPMKSLNVESLETAREAMAAMRQNPNDRYVLLLSEEARLRYNRALFGVDDPNDLEADNLRDPADPTAGGCAAQAQRAIPGVFAARSALAEEFVALRQAVLTSVRVKSAEAQWASCMQKQGYTLESPRALRRQMDVDLAQTLGNAENLKRLGAEHRKAVQDSAACVQQSGLEAAVAAVQLDHERAFVKKHRKFLESFLRTLEQQDLEGE